MGVRFSQTHVENAIRDARAGKAYDQTDSACTGLTLRVGPRGAAWGYKAMSRDRIHRLAIGPVGKASKAGAVSLDDARAVANAARRHLKEGGELTPEFLAAELVRLGLAEAAPVPPPPDPAVVAERARAAAEARLWTLAQAREAYLAEVKRTRRWDTWDDYRKMTGVAELTFLGNERVCRITRQMLAEIVTDIHRSGRERHAEHLASVLRPMWTFLQRDDVRRESGVTEDMRLLRAPERSKGVRVRANGKEPGGYTASPMEVGFLLACCGEEAFDFDISLALTMMLITGQRRRPIASALIEDFVPWTESQGWGVWSMSASHRKTADRRGDKARHAIPLPPVLWLTVQEQIVSAHAQGSPYLYPQRRPGRANEAGDGHLSPSVLNHRLGDLGIRASPHDFRRAMTNTLQTVMRIPRSDVKLLTDHNEGIARGDTLEMHYTDDDRLDLKKPAMQAWCDWCYDREGEASERLPPIAELRKMLTLARKAKTARGLGRERSYGLLSVSESVDPEAVRRRRDEHVAATVTVTDEWREVVAEHVARKRPPRPRVVKGPAIAVTDRTRVK
jgi:hypothetical protein